MSTRKEQRKPQAPKAKPVRYWPGKAPVQEAESSDSENEVDDVKNIRDISVGGPSNEPSVTVIDSTRLKRLLNKQENGKEQVRHVVPTQGGDSGDESEEEVMRRGMRMREMALKRQQQQDEEPTDEIEALGAKDEESDSSEYTTDDSEDDVPRAPLFKPVFIPKSHRDTVIEKERLEDESEIAAEKKKQQAEKRKLESHELVAEELRREMAAASMTDGPPDVDDTDGADEDAEYDAWKLRELTRIKRDREEQDALDREKAEIERRRNMTDAEVIAENELLRPKEDNSKYQFMQKYYHKGAFYADEEILKRDYNQPTLEDKFDKSILPAVMQVKKFGKIGQTKWTHLTNEDTSIGDSAWFQKSDVNKRILSKMAGMEQSFQKPTKRTRLS
ncbi:splicing factor, Prp19-binding domain-containing protein [Chytridium lagenaria]|nr:splicing factor, Prp19-binding domain-containing protein [Chytridium lagenaria]